VIVKGKISMESVSKLRNGVEISNYTTQPAKVFLKTANEERSELRISIYEGKNRQIRKMLETVGHEVTYLKRLQIGEIKLAKMPTGSWRFLKDSEILYLLKLTRK
jgi:23S rRNA pseudouridine2605 synthase